MSAKLKITTERKWPMRVAYYADDGTEFESEEACHNYERRLHDLMHEHQHFGFYAYNSDGNEVDFSEYDLESLEDAFQDISYLKFDSQKAIEVFLKQARYYGLCELGEDLKRQPVVGEHYFYDWDKDKWVCLEDKYKELDKIAAIFK
jgi:hypothetical protein